MLSVCAEEVDVVKSQVRTSWINIDRGARISKQGACWKLCRLATARPGNLPSVRLSCEILALISIKQTFFMSDFMTAGWRECRGKDFLINRIRNLWHLYPSLPPSHVVQGWCTGTRWGFFTVRTLWSGRRQERNGRWLSGGLKADWRKETWSRSLWWADPVFIDAFIL